MVLLLEARPSTGGITFESATKIDLNAPLIGLNGNLSMAGGPMSFDPQTQSFAINANQIDLYATTTASMKGSAVSVNGTSVNILGSTAPVVGFPGATPGSVVPYSPTAPNLASPTMLPLPAVPSLVVQNSYGDTPIV